MDTAQFLDEFRPFRRGELALARRLRSDPLFLPEPALNIVRYALRLGQLSSVGPKGERDALVDRIGFARLRLLQLLAPALPTDPEAIEARELIECVPRIAHLVDGARRNIVESGLASAEAVDADVGEKRLALVLGGAAGSGWSYLGALARLEARGLRPAYLVGCSIGSILATVRARRREFELESLYEELLQLSVRDAFRAPTAERRYGLPAAARLDLRAALGHAFRGDRQELLRLSELPIPVDAVSTGLGPGALAGSPESYAELVGADVKSAAELAELRPRRLARAVSALVSLAMSRRLLVPVAFGATRESAEIAAIDAAGFSAAIPAFLHYDLEAACPAVDSVFAAHELTALVDGAMSAAIPARFAWNSIESGRFGTRSFSVVALDALAAETPLNRPVRPILRAIAATSERDRPYWDLCVRFRKAPSLLEVFPREGVIRAAAESGQEEFEEPARVLELLHAPVPPWESLAAHAEPLQR